MDDRVLWFNFGDYGAPGYVPVTLLESKIMLRAAEDIIERNSRAICDHIIHRRRNELIHQAAVGEVDDDWCSRALLLMALTGVMGYEIPEIQSF